MNARDFLDDNIRDGGEFDYVESWTLGMVNSMLKFAEAYERQCEANRRKAQDAGQIQGAHNPHD